MTFRKDQKQLLATTIPDIIDDFNAQMLNFERLLFSTNSKPLKKKEAIMTAWRSKSHQFQVLFAAGTITLDDYFSLIIALTTHTQWKKNLGQVMLLGLEEIAETMLNVNKEFADWFFGKLKNVGTSDVRNVCQPLGAELLAHFELVLKCGSEKIIEWFSNNNEYLQRALLSSNKQADYIEMANEAGYKLLILSDEQRISLSRIERKRKAEDKLEPEESKRFKSSASQTPDIVRRYFTRGAAAAELKLFDQPSQEKSVPLLEPKSSSGSQKRQPTQ